MKPKQTGLRSLLAGSYAWMVAVFSGAILLDVVYANRLDDLLATAERASLFAGISDLLLLVGAATVLAALTAIAVSWPSKSAMILFIASLTALSLEFMLPVFAAPFLNIIQELGAGPWLRLLPVGLASILAIAALQRYARQS
jgi:hypothetical protein